MNKSDYTAVVNYCNKYYLFNTLYGTLDEVEPRIASLNINELTKEEQKSLYNRKHLQIKPQYDIFKDLYDEYIAKSNLHVEFFIPLTLSCNLACTYCFQKGREKNHDITETSLSNIENCIVNIIDQYKAAKINKQFEIVFYGGEPLLEKNRKFILKLLEFCKNYNIKYRVITNGINIPRYLQLFCENIENLSNITITIDGSKKTHDTTRIYSNGDGSFDKICKSIDMLITNKIPYTLRVNLTPQILKSIYNRDFVVSNKNVLIYRVEYSNAELNKSRCSYADIYKLYQDNKLSIENIGLNPVKYFCYLTDNKINSYPLFKDCNNSNIYLFSLDGMNVYNCNEIEVPLVWAGRYDIPEKVKIMPDTDYRVNMACRRCEMLPICGGGCPIRIGKIATNKECPFYTEMTNMVTAYIESVLNKK